MDSTSDWITLIRDCCQVIGEHADKIPFAEAAKLAGMFGGVAPILTIAVSLMGVVPQDKDTTLILNELNELKGAVHKMHNEMRQDFRSVEALIVEHSFTKDIINKVENQQRFLENLLSARSNESIDQFKHECNIRRPQALLMDIITSIGRDVTNPIKYSMNKDPLHSMEIRNKWRREIQNLAGTLAMLHGMFCGLNGRKDDGTMAMNIRELERVLDNFEKSFELNYWNAVTNFVDITLDDYENVKNNTKKAYIISKGPTKMYTTDLFIVIVYDSTSGFDNHAFVGNESQSLLRFRRGGCCAVIYASKTAHSISYEDYKLLEQNTKNISVAMRVFWSNSLDKISMSIYEKLNKQPLITEARGYGFVGVINSELNVAVYNAISHQKNLTSEHNTYPGIYRCFKAEDHLFINNADRFYKYCRYNVIIGLN